MPVIKVEGLTANHYLGPVGILLKMLPPFHSFLEVVAAKKYPKLCLLTHTNISDMCHHRLIKFLFKGIDFQVFIPIFIYLLPQESKHRYSGVILLQYKYDFGREVFFVCHTSILTSHCLLHTAFHKALI